MKVTVKFTPLIRVLTKTDQMILDLPENTKINGLLKVLKERYGERLIDLLYASEMGSHDSWASIIIDGRTSSLTPELDVELKEGSVVVLLAAVGGG